jgi:hypothetical protein
MAKEKKKRKGVLVGIFRIVKTGRDIRSYDGRVRRG